MAKVVKWRGQFADIAGTQYTVAIYGYGTTGVTGNNITLGSNPLVTSEDDSNDIFTPIRTQTGTLEVLDPDGTLMEEMLPSDNLDHPVVLKKGNEIVWKGFLSCETHTQDYTIRANVVTFNLIGVLEAMKSVKFTDADVTALGYNANIETLVKRALSKVGISNVYMPTSNGLFQRYISTAILYDEQETDYGNGVHRITLAYKSCYDIVKSVCTLAVCVCRTSGVNAFIYKAKGTDDRGNDLDIDTLTFKGTGHTKTITQGAKSVEVKGSAEKIEAEVKIPNFDNMPSAFRLIDNSSEMNDFTGDNVVCYDKTKTNGYTNIHLYTYRTNSVSRGVTPTTISNSSESISIKSSFIPIGQYIDMSAGISKQYYVGSRLSRGSFMFDKQTMFKKTVSMKDGLHCYFYPCKDYNPNNDITKPIFKMESKSSIHIVPGWININLDGYEIDMYDAGKHPVGYTDPHFCIKDKIDTDSYIQYMIKVGDKYFTDDLLWSDTPSILKVFNHGDEKNISLHVDFETEGKLEFAIYPLIHHKTKAIHNQDGSIVNVLDEYFCAEVFYNNITFKYEPDENYEESADSSEYRLDLNNSFGDDISIDTDIVSNRSNGYCKNVIRDADYNQVSTIQYGSTEVRPEIALMNEMAEQYEEPRRVLSIEVEPIAAPLPSTVITEGDRKYIPIDAEHDWRMNRSTLKLLETAY